MRASSRVSIPELDLDPSGLSMRMLSVLREIVSGTIRAYVTMPRLVL